MVMRGGSHQAHAAQPSTNYSAVCRAILIHISCLENRLRCWALSQDRGQEGRAGTCPSLTRAWKWELSREVSCYTPTSYTLPMLTERGMCSPGYAGVQAWSQTVLSSNPPKSLPGVGISSGLICNLAPSCNCGWTHTPSPCHRPNFFWCRPHPYNMGAGDMPWAGAFSLKKAELDRKASSPGVKFEDWDVLTSSSVKWVGASAGCSGSLSGPTSVLSSVQNFAHHGGGPQEVCHVTPAWCISRPVTVHAQVCAP